MMKQPTYEGLKIVTNLTWPSFKNVALDIRKALKPQLDSTILDYEEAEPGGNILFVETIRSDTLKIVKKFLPGSNVVFYGTTEGHSCLDHESIEVARAITVVAVSKFVRQMLEEVGVTVAGVVHHGVDMDAMVVDAAFLQSVKEKTGGKFVALTVADNNPRKGLDKLLQAYKIVEGDVPESFLILHSQPKSYYDTKLKRHVEKYWDLLNLASELKLERVWLTNNYGRLTSSELNALYKLCRVYVLPSYTEGLGLSMLEALRFNKPVVAVDAPPFNEVIEDGSTGILIPYEEVQWFNYEDKIKFKMHVYNKCDLAEAIIKILTDISFQERMEVSIKVKKRVWSIQKLYPRILNYF